MNNAIEKWRKRAPRVETLNGTYEWSHNFGGFKKVKARPPPLVFVDADTGHEILHFVRRKKHFIYLRDKDTKRFIQKLDFMELRVYKVVEYSEDQAKKMNPLYVDAVGKSLLSPDVLTEEARSLGDLEPLTKIVRGERCEIEDYERYEIRIGKSLEKRLVAMFGGSVVAHLLEDAGIDYGSKLTVTQRVTFNEFYYVVVWRHHPTDAPRSMEGVDTLI